MEVNKDEAQRCVDIAIDAMRDNNLQRAEKFLTKSNNLFPTQKARDLLERIRAMQSRDEGVRNRSKNGTFKAEGSSTKTTTSSGSGTETKEYTKEQYELCRRIKSCKDYYEVLSVTKEATDTEIKKSYKKLALQLHPDKNRAPGAVEAFKTLGNAAAVLTDTEKRKNYDLYGGENNRIHHSRHHYHANHEYEHAYRNANSFESDFTAEELFHMFFGNGFPQPRADNRRYHHTRHETNQREHHQQQQQPSLAFGIILVLILISMMSSFFTTDPVYSLSPSSKYPVLRKTIHLNIPYYVKDKFETDYQGSLARLENSVEEEYIMVMKQACYRERGYREIMMARARSFGNEQQLDQAKSLKVTSCENLAKIGLTKFMPV